MDSKTSYLVAGLGKLANIAGTVAVPLYLYTGGAALIPGVLASLLSNAIGGSLNEIFTRWSYDMEKNVFIAEYTPKKTESHLYEAKKGHKIVREPVFSA